MNREIVFNTKDLIKEYCNEFDDCIYEEKKNEIILKKAKIGRFGRFSKFKFPLKITLKPSTLGLIIGEGYVDNRQFVFANSNEKIIKQVLNFLNQFDIYPKFTLEVAVKNMDDCFGERSKNEWEGIISNKIENIRIRKEFNNTTERGTLHIRCYNSCFSRILKIMLEKSKNKIEINSNFAKEYIKGIIAAEGNINVKSTTTNCLYMVRISAKKKEEREHYKRCLEKIGIKIYCKDMSTIDKNDEKTKHWKTKRGRAGAVLISRWMNFYKIFSMDLLELNEDKKRKFIKHFLYNKTTKWLLDFREFPREWFTMKELRDAFGFKTKPRDRINKMLLLNFMERKRIKPKNKDPRQIYCLTDEYFEFIDKLFSDAPLLNR